MGNSNNGANQYNRDILNNNRGQGNMWNDNHQNNMWSNYNNYGQENMKNNYNNWNDYNDRDDLWGNFNNRDYYYGNRDVNFKKNKNYPRLDRNYRENYGVEFDYQHSNRTGRHNAGEWKW
jgi:hypothetical protein